MKYLLFLIPILFAIEAKAQNYLISFAGTGASNTVGTVKVENLMTGAILTLYGDEILHLTFTTGVNPDEIGQSSEMKIYPNPMIDNSILEIYPPTAGNAIISIYDITGKQVAQIHDYLEQSVQGFKLTGLKKGFYLIDVKGNAYKFSGKLLSNGEAKGMIEIQRIDITSSTIVGKTSTKDNKGAQASIDMMYTNGDKLQFTGISGKYTTIIVDVPTTSKVVTFTFIDCTDGDGNDYPVVQIGTGKCLPQIWMAENLKTTKYRNGDLIGTTTPVDLDIEGETEPKYQWAAGGKESNVATYGRFYTWFAVMDSRNLCPTGWHVPTDAEWTTLTDYFLGGLTVAGGKLKETGTMHWVTPNTGATNETGFTALPGGDRDPSCTFNNIGNYCFFWTAAGNDGTTAWSRWLYYNKSIVTRQTHDKKEGFSVRCIKD